MVYRDPTPLDPDKDYTAEELAKFILEKMKGEHTREAMARSLLKANEVAEWAREVAQQLIDGSFDEGALNTAIEQKLNDLETEYAPQLSTIKNEVEDARGSDQTLGDRLDGVSSQLAHKANYSYIDNKVQQVADGAPKGTYPTLTELQNALPNGDEGNYVVAENGHIFNWEGTSWVDTGILYQAVGIAQGSVTPKETTFATSKNKFNGSYTPNVILAGDVVNGFKYLSDSGGFCVVFKGEKGKTYTVSRSKDTDRYGIAINIGEPVLDANMTRAINANTASWDIKTITLQGDEDHIILFVSSSAQNKIPSQFQIEEGSNATEYNPPNSVTIKLESKSIPSNALDLRGLEIEPSHTTFTQKGNNLFGGEYTEKRVLEGSPSTGFVFRERDGGYTVVFKGEKGKTYTVSRSNDTDSFGVAVNVGLPRLNFGFSRDLNSNTLKWNSYTVTLEGEEDHIICYVSSSDENKKPGWLQIEEGEKFTRYSPPNSAIINSDIIIPRKKGVTFGDSLTQLKTYPEKLSGLTGHTIYDVSFAGSVMSYRTPQELTNLGFRGLVDAIVSGDYSLQEQAVQENESARRENFETLKGINWEEIDFATILLGTNDFHMATPIGDGEDLNNHNQFKSAMRYAIETLLSAYPHLQLYFITPIWRHDWDIPRSGHVLTDYCDTIQEVCEMYQIPCLDLFNTSGINKFTKEMFLRSDEVHTTEKGDTLLAEKIAKFIDSY